MTAADVEKKARERLLRAARASIRSASRCSFVGGAPHLSEAARPKSPGLCEKTTGAGLLASPGERLWADYFFFAAGFLAAGAVGAGAAAAFFAGAAFAGAAALVLASVFAAGAAVVFAAAAVAFFAIAVIPLCLREFSFTESPELSRLPVKLTPVDNVRLSAGASRPRPQALRQASRLSRDVSACRRAIATSPRP